MNLIVARLFINLTRRSESASDKFYCFTLIHVFNVHLMRRGIMMMTLMPRLTWQVCRNLQPCTVREDWSWRLVESELKLVASHFIFDQYICTRSMHYIPVWSAPEVQNFTAEKSYKATTKVTKLHNFVTFTEKGLLRKSYRVTKLQNGDSIHITSLY